MRAAAILGLGCSAKDLSPFQSDNKIEWRMGMPASGDEADVVLLFGGDGTIHRHLSQLVKLGLPVLVVPAGSGNDFARALGLRRVRDSLAAWRKFCGGAGNARRVDLGVIAPVEEADGESQIISDEPADYPTSRANDAREMGHPQYFCCVAGVGLDGEVTARANRLPRWLRGNGGYALSLAPTIFTYEALPMKILRQAEGDDLGDDPASKVGENAGWVARCDRPTLLAAFANTPMYGGGMKIAPRAKMDDGLLEVCVVGAVERFRLLRLFPTIYSGRHLKVKEVEYFQAERVRVQTEHPVDVYADGEYVGQTPVEISVHRAALRMVTL